MGTATPALAQLHLEVTEAGIKQRKHKKLPNRIWLPGLLRMESLVLVLRFVSSVPTVKSLVKTLGVLDSHPLIIILYL